MVQQCWAASSRLWRQAVARGRRQVVRPERCARGRRGSRRRRWRWRRRSSCCCGRCRARLGERRLHFLLRNDRGRFGRDDRGCQLVAFMEFVHRSWLAIHEDLHSALVEFALSKQTHSLGGSNIHGRPRHERDSAALHLRDSDGRNRRCCRDRRRPGHPGLQITDRQRLPVDGEHETRRHVDLPRALGQSDDEIVPVHSDDFELLDLSGREWFAPTRRRRSGIPARWRA